MSLLQQAPRFEPADAVRLARELYDLQSTATSLPSERDQNFRLDTPEGRFVLKVANASESRAMLEAQNAAMILIARECGLAPRPVPAPDGHGIVEGPGGHLVRLLTWIPGVPLGEVRHRTRPLLEDLGRRLGAMDRALERFDHPAIRREFYWDLALALRTARERLPLVADSEWRDVIGRELDGIEKRRGGALAAFRRSAIHNDANDYNVIAAEGGDLFPRHQHITGVIDFGDMLHSLTVAELAVGAAYAILDEPAPIQTAADVVRGYHAAFPLHEEEIGALFDLIKLRLCLSACVAADQQAERPADEYLAISQAPIRRTLPLLSRVPVAFAEAAFRQACGIDPVPRAPRITRSLREAGNGTRPRVLVGDTPLRREDVLVVDLSPGSPLIAGDPEGNATPALSGRIANALRAAGATVALGRYREPRLLYSSHLFDGEGGERRTVHLGLDLFVPSGTAVRAPLAGVVHALADNTTPLDYGPVVILRHETGEGDECFTLYGHLTRETLSGLEIGRHVDAGDRFAAVGSPDVNGGWPPHLHFQLIADLMDLGCDFPGVCRASEVPIWEALSPDPGPVLGLTNEMAATCHDLSARTLAARRARIGRSVRTSYRVPLKIVRGWMQYLFDHTGRRFLDAYNNVPHVGHCHPRVVEAASAQMRVLNTNTRYLHDALAGFAERLTGTLPAPLGVCYFVNSGSEANELALRLARAHTRRHDVLVLEHAYHGNTTTLVDMSPYKFDGPGGAGKPPWVHVVPLPDVFRGRYRRAGREAASAYAARVAEALERLRDHGREVAAFIAESCPSVGGQIVFPPGYLASVYALVREAGGVCIADEVQTAYGRMGSSFYAFEGQQIVPDIVVLGKPIGNGYPLGAVVTTDEIAASFDNGMEFFSTFGGSTVSCAVGLTVLDVVRTEGLQAHAAETGSRVIEALHEVASRRQIVGDVRGSGFFLGVELVSDRGTLEPASEATDYVVNRMREEGILIGTEGPFHNVLKIRPPMPFGLEDGQLLVETLDDILGEIE
ncbi:MAG TPA: aminotransferase class III-fold pyridoxal phosphate-dependent enzyme [Vicinamibacterales bacterium]|nr:aminotransferase class III-fold pyridoxal phosphate-dependent enzyme [Vicinamibacterales bacterium]